VVAKAKETFKDFALTGTPFIMHEDAVHRSCFAARPSRRFVTPKGRDVLKAVKEPQTS
jgi:hypothetical protein